MLGDKVRVLRIIEYIGDETAILKSLEQRLLKGEVITPNMTIREAYVGFQDIFGVIDYKMPEPKND